jgi:hypothetical protein
MDDVVPLGLKELSRNLHSLPLPQRISETDSLAKPCRISPEETEANGDFGMCSAVFFDRFAVALIGENTNVHASFCQVYRPVPSVTGLSAFIWRTGKGGQ